MDSERDLKLTYAHIISLADDLDNKEELWEAWKKLNRAMSYLSAKHTMAEVKGK